MNDEGTSTAGVAALDRAIAILKAFTAADRSLSLAEISARTGLYKSTILRLAASLIRANMLERLEDGRYRIGAALFALGSIYQRSLVPADILLPIMRELSDLSSESVAFYVRSGDVRTCLYRIEIIPFCSLHGAGRRRPAARSWLGRARPCGVQRRLGTAL